MKLVQGYTREHPQATPVPGSDVTIRDANTGLAIPVGGMIAASANPVVSDSNGYFYWEAELSPGPIYVVAEMGAGEERRIRHGREIMQAGDGWINDLHEPFRHFTNGVVVGAGNEFLVSPVTGNRRVRLRAGKANLRGQTLELSSERTFDVPANTTLDTRIDTLILEQETGGDYIGRQNIRRVQGTAHNTPPTIESDTNTLRFPLYHIYLNRNATSVTVEDQRVYSSVILGPGSVGEIHFDDTVPPYIHDLIAAALLGGAGITITPEGDRIRISVDTAWLGPQVRGITKAQLQTLQSLDIAEGTDTLTFTVNQDWLSTFLNSRIIAGNNITKSFNSDTGRLTINAVVPPQQPNVRVPRSQDRNFGYMGTTGYSLRTLGSVSLSLPPGSWMIQSNVDVSMRGNGAGNGYQNVRLVGNGTPQGNQASTRNFHTNPGRDRQTVLSGRRVVTHSVTTTYTVTAQTVQHSGASTFVDQGVVYMVAS